MPSGSAFKLIVRARMDITGEKYTVALRAVLRAARTAVPYGRGGRHDSVPGLATATSSDFLATSRRASAKRQNKNDGDIHLALADFCEYQAEWWEEHAADFPEVLEIIGPDTYKNLMACATELRSIPPDDPRILTIASAWANKTTLGLMQTVEGSVVGDADFELTAQQLIDLLSTEAVQLLTSLEAG
ncbi:MAG TPA: hypothetical protein VMC03_03430 [Streptosporangiaceae bacterium]|nr:hypothetical protein [Streptosporangiaceae bacterium]